MSASYREFVLRAWRKNHMLSALIELTYRCNWDCHFCYNDLSLRGTPLTTDQFRKLFEDLREMQVINLILTGGEPLAHPDFLALASYARSLEFAIRIKSNGHALRGRLARRIRDEVAPQLIEVSLHGATAETHDRQTRVAGSFDRLLQNIDEMLGIGLPLKINTTLTRWNEHELEAMFALTDSIGAPFQVDPEVTPRDDGNLEPLAIAASQAALVRLFELQRDRSRQTVASEGSGTPYAGTPESTESDKHCGAGSSVIAVDPFGTVYPCVQWRRACGNLHDRSIADIWQGDGMREIRDSTKRIKRQIGELENGADLGFCPGAADSYSGRFDEIYPAAARRREVVGRVSLPVIGQSVREPPTPADQARSRAPAA